MRRASTTSERLIVKTMRHSFSLAATLCAVTTLIGCGGAKNETPADHDDAPSVKSAVTNTAETGQSGSPAAKAASESAELQVRDDTADAAMETYLEGVKQGKLEIALAVLHPDSPGANALTKIMKGWKQAEADGAPVAMAIALMAGEIDALSYEKTADDGSFATFRFTDPSRAEPWEIEAIKTSDGWRIKPPDSGLPTG